MGKIVVTRAERAVLREIRKFLAEQGYKITPVARSYRRHQTDRLVVDRGNAQHFFVLRITAQGWLSVVSYLPQKHYPRANAALESAKKHCKKVGAHLYIRWNRRRLTKLHKGYEPWWTYYFPRELYALARRTVGINPSIEQEDIDVLKTPPPWAA